MIKEIKKRVLHIYSVQGNLGDAIRINEMGKFLEKHYDYQAINLADNLTTRFSLSNFYLFIKGLILGNSIKTIKEKIYLDRCRQTIKQKIENTKFKAVVAEMAHLGYATIKAIKNPKIKIIVDLHGLVSAEYQENKYTKKDNDFYRFLKKVENYVYCKSDILLCVSNNLKKIIKKTNTQAQVIIVPNGTQKSKYSAKFGRPLKIIYGGIFAFWEDLDTFLDLAKLDKTNKYYLMGDGPEKERLFSRIKKEKIKINYLGSKKKAEAIRIFSKMNVGVAPSTTGLTRKVAIPIKIYDYLSVGLPVVTCLCGEWGDDIQRYEAGYVAKKSQAKLMLQGIKELENESTWHKKNQNALRLAKKRYWQKILTGKLTNLIQ